MADIVDMAEGFIEDAMERAIKKVKNRKQEVSKFCVACDDEIQKERREAIKTNLCFYCADDIGSK